MTGINIKVGLGDGMYFINPKDDITALEAAKLNIFLTYITVPRGFNFADPPDLRKNFLIENNLMRHFDKEVKDGN